MAYDPSNNPYIPGDPYSYDLKWMVREIKGWKDPLDSADRAKASEEAAKLSEQQSEAWAVGTIDGEAVPADAPQHDNNSKHWSDEAAGSAADAAASEAAAADYAAHIADPVSGLVTDWLADHITQPTTPAIDTSLSVAGAAADAKATGDEITDLKDNIEFINLEGNAILSLYSKFTRGSISPSTGIVDDVGYQYRVSSIDIMKINRALTLTVSGAHRFRIHYYTNGVYDGEASMSAWQRGSYTIDANKEFRILIGRAPETDTTTPADIEEFVGSVTFPSGPRYFTEKTVSDLDALMARFNGKKISIIGDSIDTYDGYVPAGYRIFYPNVLIPDVDDVSKTWWYKLIDISGAVLEVNASWSGSRVTDTAPDGYPDFYDRVGIIGSPDVIFVTLGTNDSSGSVTLGSYDYETEYTQLSESTFRTAYIKGVKALQDLYPSAEIVCITEIMGSGYKTSIQSIAETLDCEFIDASNYIPASGSHPGAKGMLQIASNVMYPIDRNILCPALHQLILW